MHRTHALTPTQLYLPRLAPSLVDRSRRIGEQADALQKENSEISDRVLKQREEIAGLVYELDSAIKELEKSAAEFENPDANLEHLVDEARDMHDETT